MNKPDEITWTCEGCTPSLTFNHDAFVVHAGKVHGVLATTVADRKMLRHVDAAEWATTTYRWTFVGFTAKQAIKEYRQGADRAFWLDIGSDK